MDACKFQHGTSGAARNDAGTFGRGAQHDLTRTEDANDAVGNRTIFERDLNQIFLCIVDAFANRFGNFGSFAEPDADFAIAVADKVLMLENSIYSEMFQSVMAPFSNSSFSIGSNSPE